MTRPRITLSWGRTNPMSCPRCQVTLRSATGIHDQPIRPHAGAVTLCDQCCTWLVFESRLFPSTGLSLRLATADEVDSIDPARRALAQRMALALSTFEPKQ